jgi:hypothetical protein
MVYIDRTEHEPEGLGLMPTSILWEPHAVVCHADGALSVDDIHQLNTDTFGDPRFEHVDSVLIDFSQVTSTTITDTDVVILASADHLYGQLDHPRRMAIACNPDIIKLRQLAEHYQLEVKDTPIEIQLFDNKTVARNWLSWEIVEHGEIS